jgi:hypothetical protein
MNPGTGKMSVTREVYHDEVVNRFPLGSLRGKA